MAKDPLITRKSYRKYKQKNQQTEKRKSWQNKLWDSLKPAVEDQSLEERVAAKKAELHENNTVPTLANVDAEPETFSHQQPAAADDDAAETRIFSAAAMADEKVNEVESPAFKSQAELPQDDLQEAGALPLEKPTKKKRFHWNHPKAADAQSSQAATPAPAKTSGVSELEPDTVTKQNKPGWQPIDKFLNISIAVCTLGIIIVSSIALFV